MSLLANIEVLAIREATKRAYPDPPDQGLIDALVVDYTLFWEWFVEFNEVAVTTAATIPAGTFHTSLLSGNNDNNEPVNGTGTGTCS